MFRPVRRIKNEIGTDLAKRLLKTARRGVLSVIGDEGYPYGVPLNFIYDEEEEKIYFHGARSGHKVDAIKACDKVCFTVFGNETIKDLDWAPYMQSTIVFGRCRLIEDHERALKLIKKMSMKYYPEERLVDETIQRSGAEVQMFEIEIEHMSGKEIQER